MKSSVSKTASLSSHLFGILRTEQYRENLGRIIIELLIKDFAFEVILHLHGVKQSRQTAWIQTEWERYLCIKDSKQYVSYQGNIYTVIFGKNLTTIAKYLQAIDSSVHYEISGIL